MHSYFNKSTRPGAGDSRQKEESLSQARHIVYSTKNRKRVRAARGINYRTRMISRASEVYSRGPTAVILCLGGAVCFVCIVLDIMEVLPGLPAAAAREACSKFRNIENTMHLKTENKRDDWMVVYYIIIIQYGSQVWDYAIIRRNYVAKRR